MDFKQKELISYALLNIDFMNILRLKLQSTRKEFMAVMEDLWSQMKHESKQKWSYRPLAYRIFFKRTQGWTDQLETSKRFQVVLQVEK